MKTWHIAALCAAWICVFSLSAKAASPAFSPSGLMPESTSVAGARNADSGIMDGAESMIDDLLPDNTAAADSSLGDTNGDGVIEGSDSTAHGYLGEESTEDSGKATDTTTGKSTDTATETAQSSSGTASEDGMGTFGVILTVVVIGAAAALLFALWPKKRNG